MAHQTTAADFVEKLYAAEVRLAGFFDHFRYAFSPVTLKGEVGDPGIYNLPSLTPVTNLTATYTAAGTPVTDSYTGTKLWDLLNDADGVTVTTAKNDILSKYVVASGSDGYKAVFSLGEIAPNFGAQPVTVAYADTGGQLGADGTDGLARMVVPGDVAGGRYVSDLVSLDVRSLPERDIGARRHFGLPHTLRRDHQPGDRYARNVGHLESVDDGNSDLHLRRRAGD